MMIQDSRDVNQWYQEQESIKNAQHLNEFSDYNVKKIYVIQMQCKIGAQL